MPVGVTLLPHSADLRLRSTGDNLEEALTGLVKGICQLMVEGPVEPRRDWIIEVSGPRTMKVVDLINDVLFLHDTEGLIACEAEVSSLADERTWMRLKGESFEEGRHSRLRHIKAATYHGLLVTGDAIEIILDV